MAAVHPSIQAFYQRAVPRPPSEPRGVLFEQEGEMRLAPDGKWLPFTAEQWCAAIEVAFCWHARVKMAPLVTAVVEDAFENGEGRLDAKVWGVIPVAHGRGVEVDRGEVQRYLAELAWNPMALLHNPKLSFTDGEEGAAVRVFSGEEQTHVDLFFDDDGDLVRTFTRTRSRGEDGPSPWEGHFSQYADFDGVRVPTRGEVSWLLPEGRYTYWRGNITRWSWRDGNNSTP
jgi:hypothetical protein